MLNQYLQGRIDLGTLLAWLIAVTIALTVHEFSHAKSADSAGDPTPRAMGRLTLNPLAHYDLVGSTLFLLFGFGWAKPVPVNPLAFRRPRRDAIMVSLWGPLSNFITAVIFAIPVRLGLAGDYTMPLVVIVYANLALGVFNLIPFGPLDGAHVLEGLLSMQANRRMQAFYHRNQTLLLILVLVILFVPSISRIVFGIIFIPVRLLLHLLIGGAGPGWW
jgi:Zn-dependent protease